MKSVSVWEYVCDVFVLYIKNRSLPMRLKVGMVYLNWLILFISNYMFTLLLSYLKITVQYRNRSF